MNTLGTALLGVLLVFVGLVWGHWVHIGTRTLAILAVVAGVVILLELFDLIDS